MAQIDLFSVLQMGIAGSRNFYRDRFHPTTLSLTEEKNYLDKAGIELGSYGTTSR